METPTKILCPACGSDHVRYQHCKILCLRCGLPSLNMDISAVTLANARGHVNNNINVKMGPGFRQDDVLK